MYYIGAAMNNRFKHSQLEKVFKSKKLQHYKVCAEIEVVTGIPVAPDTLRSHCSGRTIPNADHLHAYALYFKKPHRYFYVIKEETHAKNKSPKSRKKPHS